MFPMKRILLPIDFSDRSACAARYAAALKCRSQAELTVLHVAPGHAPYVDVNDVCLSPAYALEIAWSEAKLSDAKERMDEFIESHLHGIPATSCVCSGDAAKVIVRRAQDSKADLIVMASHGFGGFRRMLLGSITAKVLHDAACPVFTTAHMESAPTPVAAFRNIVCAVDLGPGSEAVIRWADEFARSVSAKLILSHVLPVMFMDQWGYCDAQLTTAIRKDAEEKAKRLVETTGVEAELLVDSGGVVETLSGIAKRREADLLVIGRRHGSGFPGRLRDTAYAIIRESPCPVVSV
jgi:nucleotide-binding universal stress UspA family protein